jgi:outer membrane protein
MRTSQPVLIRADCVLFVRRGLAGACADHSHWRALRASISSDASNYRLDRQTQARTGQSVRVSRLTLAYLIGPAIAVVLSGATGAETLEEAWAVALAQNHRLAAAQFDEAAAAEDVGVAVAERRPNLALRSGYTLRSDDPKFIVREPLPGFGTFEFPYAQRNAALAGAEARLPLYTSGRISSTIQSAHAREAAAQFETAQARLDLLFAVGEAYISVLRLQREVEVAEHDLASLEAHLTDVQQLRVRERVAEQDLLAAQAAVATARQGRASQQRALEVARGQYNRLLDRPLAQTVQLVEVGLPPLEWKFEQLVATACEKRPDLQALMAASDSHVHASETARAEGKPQVVATVGANYEENRYQTPNALATAAVVVDWNLYNGGKTNRKAGAEEARAASARRLVDDLRSQIALELLNATNAVAEASEQMSVAAQNLAHATENLRVTRLRFGKGMALNSAVLDAEAQWLESTRDHHNAHYAGALAQLRLRYLAALL